MTPISGSVIRDIGDGSRLLHFVSPFGEMSRTAPITWSLVSFVSTGLAQFQRLGDIFRYFTVLTTFTHP